MTRTSLQCFSEVKHAWLCRCLAPQLVPSWTSSERTFEQCSPSPHSTATAESCIPRKSQLGAICVPFREEQRASLEGLFIVCCPSLQQVADKTPSPPSFGRRRRINATPRKSREATIHLHEEGKTRARSEGAFRIHDRADACLARVLPGKPRELAIESLRIFQVRAMSNALVHRFFGMWNTGQ